MSNASAGKNRCNVNKGKASDGDVNRIAEKHLLFSWIPLTATKLLIFLKHSASLVLGSFQLCGSSICMPHSDLANSIKLMLKLKWIVKQELHGAQNFRRIPIQSQHYTLCD